MRLFLADKGRLSKVAHSSRISDVLFTFHMTRKNHSMKTTAAVLVATDRPLELIDLEIPALRAGQVLIEVSYSGVCHTQLLEVGGHRGEDKFLPHCLGHEGSGTVLEVGPDVSKCQPGDRVILSWMKGLGAAKISSDRGQPKFARSLSVAPIRVTGEALGVASALKRKDRSYAISSSGSNTPRRRTIRTTKNTRWPTIKAIASGLRRIDRHRVISLR